MAVNDIFLGRQPILDRDQRIVAYELLFRTADTSSVTVTDDILQPDAAGELGGQWRPPQHCLGLAGDHGVGPQTIAALAAAIAVHSADRHAVSESAAVAGRHARQDDGLLAEIEAMCWANQVAETTA
jgi:hypothetical protein